MLHLYLDQISLEVAEALRTVTIFEGRKSIQTVFWQKIVLAELRCRMLIKRI